MTAAQETRFRDLLHTAKANCIGGETADKAIHAADQGLLIKPNNTELLCLKGSALMSKEEDNEALQCFDQAYKIDHQAYFLQGKAHCLLKLRRKEEALAAINQSLKILDFSEARMLRAKILEQFNRWEEAKHDLDTVITQREREKNCKYSNLIFPKGHRAEVEIHLKQWAKALEDLTFCLNDPDLIINQGSYNQFLQRGQVYKELKQYDKAIADYKKALKINPDYRQTHIGLAEVYKLSGKLDLAKAEMKEVDNLDQDLAPVK